MTWFSSSHYCLNADYHLVATFQWIVQVCYFTYMVISFFLKLVLHVMSASKLLVDKITNLGCTVLPTFVWVGGVFKPLQGVSISDKGGAKSTPWFEFCVNTGILLLMQANILLETNLNCGEGVELGCIWGSTFALDNATTPRCWGS